MQRAKAPEITQEIERRISLRGYEDKLPSCRALAAEFQVARQTLTEALRPLVKTGLLLPARRNGIGIDRTRLRHGKLVVVTTDAAHPAVRMAAAGLLKQIAADGFEPCLLGRNRIVFGHGELPSDTVGMLFINSALTVETAEYLDRIGMPFVSCNQLPSYPRIHVMGFDNLASCRILAEEVAAAGYRRFGVFFSGHLEGYNDLLRSNILRLKRQLGIPHEIYDDVVLDWREDTTVLFRRTLEFMARHHSHPEVLLCFCALSEECAAMLEAAEFGVPDTMTVLAMKPEFGTAPSRIRMFRGLISYEEFWLHGYRLLREAVFTPEMNRVKRLLVQKFEFDVSLLKIKQEVPL